MALFFVTIGDSRTFLLFIAAPVSVPLLFYSPVTVAMVYNLEDGQ